MKNKKPSIRQLEYFVGVAMTSNFRRAAEKLNVSQPTLTSQITTLEETMNTQLFERSRAGTLLSSTGRELLPMAKKVLDQYQQLLDQAANTSREFSGTFKIGVSSSTGPYLLPRVLPELHRRYPKLRLHIREATPKQLEAGLDEGIFDFILTVLPVSSNENKVRPLFIEPIKLVLSAEHPLAVEDAISAADLFDQDMLTLGEQNHLHKQISPICERYGVNLQEEYEGTSLATLKQMVVMGMGVTFLPALYLQVERVHQDNIKVTELSDHPITRTHVASWRQNSASRHLFQKISYDIKSIAMEEFLGILEEVSSEENG